MTKKPRLTTIQMLNHCYAMDDFNGFCIILNDDNHNADSFGIRGSFQFIQLADNSHTRSHSGYPTGEKPHPEKGRYLTELIKHMSLESIEEVIK